jgi:hypothetical protein
MPLTPEMAHCPWNKAGPIASRRSLHPGKDDTGRTNPAKTHRPKDVTIARPGKKWASLKPSSF